MCWHTKKEPSARGKNIIALSVRDVKGFAEFFAIGLEVCRPNDRYANLFEGRGRKPSQAPKFSCPFPPPGAPHPHHPWLAVRVSRGALLVVLVCAAKVLPYGNTFAARVIGKRGVLVGDLVRNILLRKFFSQPALSAGAVGAV